MLSFFSSDRICFLILFVVGIVVVVNNTFLIMLCELKVFSLHPLLLPQFVFFYVLFYFFLFKHLFLILLLLAL